MNELSEYTIRVIGFFAPAMLCSSMSKEWYGKYFKMAYKKGIVPEHAAVLIERAYKLFHHNAKNRWRRWDYVKPEADQWILKLDVSSDEIPYPKFNSESFINLTNIRMEKGRVCKWYPIPNWE